MENNSELIALCEAKAKQWLTPVFDADTQKAVKEMLDKEDKTDLIESFYKNLEFGTGGLRGIMGAGSNRMNVYTVGIASTGLCKLPEEELCRPRADFGRCLPRLPQQ